MRVGVDLAKRVIQVHAVDAAGAWSRAVRLPRARFIDWCAQPAGWLRRRDGGQLERAPLGEEALALGLDAADHRGAAGRALPQGGQRAARTTPTTRPRSARRPHARRCASCRSSSVEQQSMLCVHRLREGIKEERTACINRIRGLLGRVRPRLRAKPQGAAPVLADVLEDASNEMGTLARLTLQRAHAQWRELDEHLAWCDERIDAHRRKTRN